MKKLIFLILCFFMFSGQGLAFDESNTLLSSLILKAPAASGSGCSGNYGRTSESGTQSSGYANRMYIYRVTLNCDGSNPTVHVFLGDAWNSSNRVKLIVYDDDGGSGEPGTRLFVGSAQYDVDSLTSPVWFTDSTSISVYTGDVWVGFIQETGGIDRVGNSIGTSDRRYINNADFNPPATWNAAGDTHSDYDMSAYLSF